MFSLLAVLFNIVSASPAITLPIANQYPPVALVGQPFNFRFAPTTFTASDNTSLTYRAQNTPHWLSLDAATRTLFGTPQNENVGQVSFDLVATDGTGSTVAQITLLVDKIQSIEPPTDIAEQLAKYGSLSTPQTLSFSTSTPFNVVFAPHTFRGPPGISYAATSANNAPLPSWIHFDPQTLSFSGLTPPLTAIPQTFGVRLVATLVEGYAAAAVTFFFVINDHRLAFQHLRRTVNVTNGKRFVYTALLNELFLDGQPIDRDQIAGATAETPRWLDFNSHTLVLSGEPPSDMNSADIRISVADIYEDKAEMVLHLRAQSSLFRGRIGQIKATIGKHFQYTINRDLFSSQRVSVSIKFGSKASWLHFNASTLTLHGNLPRSLRPEVLNATIIARVSAATQSQSFTIRTVRPRTSKHRHVASSTSAVNPQKSTASKTPISSPHSTPETSRASKKLGTGSRVGIATGCLIVVLLALWLMSWRRQRAGLPLIPWNIFGRFRPPTIKDSATQDRHKEKTGEESTMTAGQGNSAAPQIEIKYFNGQRRISSGSSLPSADAATVDHMNRTSLGTDAITSHVPHDAMKIASQMGRQAADGIVESDRNRKHRSSYQPQRRSGLPTNRVLTGLGHGRLSSRSFAASGFSNPRLSAAESGSWNTASSGSEFSMQSQIDSFPSVGRASRNLALASVPEDAQRLTIRPVSKSDDSKAETWHLDRRPLEEKRLSYVRRRASTSRTNMLFGAGVGKTPSVSSTKQSRLAQRSYLYRSRSSSVGVGLPARSLPLAVRERHEFGYDGLNDVEIADRSSIYSQEQKWMEEEEENDLELEDKSERRRQRFNSSTRLGLAMGDAPATETVERECLSAEGCHSSPMARSMDRETERDEAQSVAGSRMQKLVDAGEAPSNTSSLSGSARFI